MSCNQFLAPNGEPSLLYAALLQKYGEDRALQLWTWSKSSAFKSTGKDVNGEPFVSDVIASLESPEVQFQLKSTKLLMSPKGDEIFRKGDKHGWSVEKMLNELQIPAAQKELILSFNTRNREEIITNLLANYSYAVEINTATQPDVYSDTNESNTQHYSDLTVAGGTNYTENEIATPAITPSIKGHAQFATDQGIGWFRSDDKENKIVGWKEEDDFLNSETAQYNPITKDDRVIFGHPTIGKSYLKQKGSNDFITLDDDYANEVNAFIDANKGTETRQEYKGRKPKEYNEFMLNLFDRLKVQAKKEGKRLFVSNTNILKERMSEFDKVITIPKDEFKKRFDARGATYGFEDWKSDIDTTVAKVDKSKVISTTGYLSDLLKGNPKTRRILEVQSDLFQKGRLKEDLILSQNEDNVYNAKKEDSTREEFWIAKEKGKQVSLYNNTFYEYNGYYYDFLSFSDKYYKIEKNSKIDTSENQFLQLLNKDNNWVTFFVKSIIQDSAKKGYEKVLFPSGDTAAKVEGHETVQGFIDNKERRRNTLQQKLKEIDSDEFFNKTYYIKDRRIYTHVSQLGSPAFIKEVNSIEEAKEIAYGTVVRDTENELQQIQKEIEDAKAGKLKISSIAKFYEETVFNVLKKQGYNPTRITDEYGNDWYEVNSATQLGAINFALTPSINPQEFTNHSGGADGADREWDQIGRKYGFINHNHYREPGKNEVDSATLHNQGIRAIALDAETYAQGKVMADNIDRLIGENPNRGYGHYRYRNYGQVKNSDAIFAISSGFGTRPKMSTKALMPLDRGTIYAIVGGVLDGKPVYVFDQQQEKWFTYNKETKKFEVMDTIPILTKNYAGIGSRTITEAGKKAIADVYEATLKASGIVSGNAGKSDIKVNLDEVTLDPFLKSFDAELEHIYTEARKNPDKNYTLPFTPETRVKINSKWYSGIALANYVDRADAPVNVTYSQRFSALLKNIPKRFIELTGENPVSILIDRAAVDRQMNSFFVQVRDANREPTGKWFDYEIQQGIIDGIMFQFYGMFTEMNTNPKIQQEFEASGKNTIQFLRDKVFQRMESLRTAWTNIASGKTVNATEENKLRAPEMAGHFTGLVNSFHGKGGFWSFTLQKLDSLGLKVKVKATGEIAETSDQAILRDEETGELVLEEGNGLQDYFDSSLELAQKDTASARMKLFLATIPQTTFKDEERPKEVTLKISNENTRISLQDGTKRDVILKTSMAEENKWTPAAEVKVTGTEKNASERVASVNGVDMRVTAVKRLRQEDLTEEFVSRIKAEEGFEPQVGDVLAAVEKYEQKKSILDSERTILGMPKLADFEALFQDLSGILADKPATWEAMSAVMRISGNANIQRVLERLEDVKTPEHVRKEFVSVFSAHYQRMLMVLMKRSKNGMLEARIIDSNRNSEKNTIINFWKESQKTTGLLVKDTRGISQVDPVRAKEFWDRLQAIYNTSAPARSLSAEEAQKRYGKEYGKYLKEEDKKVAAQVTINEQTKSDLFDEVLRTNGIELDARAKADLFKNITKLGKGMNLTAVFGGFTADGKPIGLMDSLVWAMYNGGDEVQDEETEEYKANNPLYTESKALSILSSVQLKYTPQAYSQTHKSTEGKTIYSYGLNSAVSHAIRKFKEDDTHRKSFEGSTFAKNSWLYEVLNNNPKMRDQFQLAYLDGLRNEYGSQEGVVRSGMSNREQWMTAISLFQNGGNTNMHMMSLTHADKTKTPLFMNVPRITGVSDVNMRFTPATVKLVYHSVFKAEYERMLANDGGKMKGYSEGKKHFFFLPMFNLPEMNRLVKQGKITEADKRVIWNERNEINPITVKGWNDTVEKIIRLQLEEMVTETKQALEESQLFESGVPGNEYYIDKVMSDAGFYKNWDDKSDKAWKFGNGNALEETSERDVYKELMIRSYVLNSFMFNTSLSQVFYGDPALAWKGDVEKTDVEYGKRLAKDIAPGRDGEFSHSPNYVALSVNDYTPAAKELNGLRGYDKVEATDAQEVTTMQEHLDVLYGYGKITQQQYAQATGIINNAKGKYYKFPRELEQIIFQPQKPVATGLRHPDEYGVMYYDYVKSSSFPLYPPVIAGMEMDKLRVAMEKGGVARLNFNSARKLGLPATSFTLYNNDGTISDDAFKSPEWISARQTMDRSMFRLQQEVPYDEDKDSILIVSQMNKNIVEKIPTVKSLFSYKGEMLNGSTIRNEKEGIRIEMINRRHAKFLKDVGAEINPETEEITFNDKKKFYRLLAQEAAGRDGYTVNDILALSTFEQDGKLTVPLIFAPSASRFEGLMMSMIKSIVKIKMPGKSFVQGSPAGFQNVATWEDSNLNENDIVWTKPFTGSLKTAHITEDGIQPAQVLVGFNYFDSDGSRINIQDYIIDVDGKKMLDTERLPAALFQLIGARIPNQGHSSMLPIEIVGFLPQAMGDLIIVPAAITKQMGADFDVDKLYTYHRSYRQEGNKLVVEADSDTDEGLLNDYFDIHWSVLNNTDMFKSMMAPLDKSDLSDEAKLLNPTSTSSKYYFSPVYQMGDFQSMKGAKILVGQTSLALTHNAVIQNRDIHIAVISTDNDPMTKEFADAGVIPKVILGTEITVLDDNEKEIKLTHVSGYGTSTYKDQVRTKADNIQSQQSEAVDHAKNRIIDKLNLDPTTASTSLIMSRFQTADEGTPGEEGFVPGKALNLTYNTRLLMQPIVREFAGLMATTNDSLSTKFETNAREKIYETLRKKYTEAALELATPSEVEEIIENYKFNPQRLLDAIKFRNKAEWYATQVAALNLFAKFDMIGQQMVTFQSITAQDTRGAGQDMLTSLNTADKKASPAGINDPIFMLGMDTVFNSEESLPTEVGATYNATVETANFLFQEDLPYTQLQDVYKYIQEQSGRESLTDEHKRLIFRAVKSFVFSSKDLGLFESATLERQRLLYGADSLGKRIQKAKLTWGRSNYFLQRLSTTLDPDGIYPDLVEYSAAKVSRSDDFENSRAWLDLLKSDNADRKALADDLLKYLFVTGGLQSARNYVKFIPWSVIEGTGIAEALRNSKERLKTITTDFDIIQQQIIQHNPSLAKQMSDTFSETGNEYALPPDSFTLPPLSEDPGTPTAKLAIKWTDDQGKPHVSYPTYLSYRDKTNNKWLLYRWEDVQNGKVTYVQIDTLGDRKSTLQEYDAGSQFVRSVFPKNRNTFVADASNKTSADGIGINGRRAMQQIGLPSDTHTAEDIKSSLEIIAIDGQQPSYLRVIAAAMSRLRRNTAESGALAATGVPDFGLSMHTDPTNSAPGELNSLTGQLMMNPKFLRNKQEAAEILNHEVLHYHTGLLTMAYGGESYWNQRGFNPFVKAKLAKVLEFIKNNPEVEQKMAAIEALRSEAYKRFQQKIITNSGLPYWNKVKEGDGSSFDNLNYYALNNLPEFITHIFTNQDVINFLNSEKYEGKKSFLEHIKELISQFWGALVQSLGVQTGTLMEEAVKRSLDLLTYQQTVNSNWMRETSGDYAAFAVNRAMVTSSQLDSVSRIIGKLEEQRWSLIASQPQIKDPLLKAQRRREIATVDEQLKDLKESNDLLRVPIVGTQQLNWVEGVLKKDRPSVNELNVALQIANMWKGAVELMFNDTSIQVDDDLTKVSSRAARQVYQLNKMVRESLKDQFELTENDLSDANIQDVGKDESLLRSLQSASKNKVISKVSQFISTVGRQEDEEVQREMHSLTKLEKDIKAYAKKNGISVQKVNDMLAKPGEAKDWGRTLQYSSKWFKTRESLIGERNGKLVGVDKSEDIEPVKRARRAAIWKNFYESMDKISVGVDTNAFFDPETGLLKADTTAARKKLADAVGESHVQTVIDRAQERYLKYVEDKANLFLLIDSEVVSGVKTEIEAAQEKLDFQNAHSPNVFFSNSAARSLNAASEKYTTFAPRSSAKEMWNEAYLEITADPELHDIYKNYYDMIDRLMSYLPTTTQQIAGPGFVPIVTKSMVTDEFDFKEYFKTVSERAVKSVAASKWQEYMNERAYNKIPIEFVNSDEVELEDRSKDLIAIGRVFAMMATHYKHASASKDVVEMGQTILSEIHKSRIEGNSQTNQNGKVVTVKKGLSNALDALEYMKEYMIFRKPRQLELNLGSKIYVEKKDGKREFSINPIQQKKISNHINELILEKKKLDNDYVYPPEGQEAMSEIEYMDKRDKLDMQLAKYEGFTLYGSKIGDKLIGINQLKALSYNPFSAVANVTFGMISGAVHAAGGVDYSWNHFGAAIKMMTQARFDKALAEKILNTMDRLGVIGDFVDSSYGKGVGLRENRAKWKKTLDPYAMLRSTDYYMKGCTTLAMLMHDQVEVPSGEKISVWDVLDQKGEWNKEKYEENAAWSNEDVSQQPAWDKLRNKIIKVNITIHGNQDKNSPKLANKFILGRLLGQFRMSWLPEGWYNRFQSERFDDDLDRVVKGRYRSYGALGWGGSALVMGRQFLNLIPGVKVDPFKGQMINKGTDEVKMISDSPVDIENMRRNFVEAGFYLTLASMILTLKYLRDDDDEDPIKNAGMQLLLNMMIRTQQDIDLYASPGVFNAVFRNPIPASNVIADYAKLIRATGKLVIDDEYEYSQWLLKMTKAGLPIPQATQINKWKYMIERDLDDFQ